MGRLLQDLKNAGVIVGALIHDLLPIDAPEYFAARTTKLFVKAVIETLTFADLVLTTSEYNKASVTRLMAARELGRVPVRLLPLARERAHAAPGAPGVSKRVEGILATDYVLCVGTIEVRKNPTYLCHVWKTMLQSGRSDVPYLVFAGRKGWLVRDLMDQLAACNHLGGRIVMVHSVADDFLRSTLALARQVQPLAGAAAMRLPPGQYLPISGDGAAILLDGIDGSQSAELACVSGWQPAGISGARAAGPAAAIRFCAAAPAGARIALVLRLAAHGRAVRIRIRSGSGAETEASLAAGAERVASLSCEVEAGNLVTAHLWAVDASSRESEGTEAGDWSLLGILYFDPQRLATAAAQQVQRGQPVPSRLAGASPAPSARADPTDGSGRDRIALSAAAATDASRRARARSVNSCNRPIPGGRRAARPESTRRCSPTTPTGAHSSRLARTARMSPWWVAMRSG